MMEFDHELTVTPQIVKMTSNVDQTLNDILIVFEEIVDDLVASKYDLAEKEQQLMQIKQQRPTTTTQRSNLQDTKIPQLKPDTKQEMKQEIYKEEKIPKLEKAPKLEKTLKEEKVAKQEKLTKDDKIQKEDKAPKISKEEKNSKIEKATKEENISKEEKSIKEKEEIKIKESLKSSSASNFDLNLKSSEQAKEQSNASSEVDSKLKKKEASLNQKETDLKSLEQTLTNQAKNLEDKLRKIQLDEAKLNKERMEFESRRLQSEKSVPVIKRFEKINPIAAEFDDSSVSDFKPEPITAPKKGNNVDDDAKNKTIMQLKEKYETIKIRYKTESQNYLREIE